MSDAANLPLDPTQQPQGGVHASRWGACLKVGGMHVQTSSMVIYLPLTLVLEL